MSKVVSNRGQARVFQGVRIVPYFSAQKVSDANTEYNYIERLEITGTHPSVSLGEQGHILGCVWSKFIGTPSWTWKLWVMVEEDFQDSERATRRLLGDWVESVFKWTGIQWVVYKIAGFFGVSCGCKARKEFLNNIHQRIIDWRKFT